MTEIDDPLTWNRSSSVSIVQVQSCNCLFLELSLHYFRITNGIFLSVEFLYIHLLPCCIFSVSVLLFFLVISSLLLMKYPSTQTSFLQVYRQRFTSSCVKGYQVCHDKLSLTFKFHGQVFSLTSLLVENIVRQAELPVLG